MLSTSKCILRNRKFLESITCKVNNGAFLHVCCNSTSIKQSKNEKRFLHLQLDKRNHLNAFLVTTIPGTRLISTSINEATNVSVKSSIDTVNESYQLGAETSPTLATEAVAVENSSRMEEVTSTQISQSDVQQHSSTTVGTETSVETSPVSEFPIPDPPTPPTPVAGEVTTTLLVDPPFEQLGLSGWSPVGLIEQGFEILHVNLDLPWWQCILIGTIIVRATLFPILVISQRNSARLSNNLPEFQDLQRKINEAKQRGENIEAARYTQDLMLFMKDKKINPIKNAIIPLVQAPVFISFFMSLREMANIPVRSMREGGLFWFTDLTVPDQMYILPIITSLTMLATIEVGADTGKMASSNSHLVKTILRCLPLVIFPFTINFPGAILLYWVSSNTISLAQVALFQMPRVRNFLKIEQKVVHDVSKLPPKPKSFIKGVKAWWKETRTQGEHLDRPRKNQLSFVTAGRGAVPKTYKYDPTISRTAQSSTSASVQSKK